MTLSPEQQELLSAFLDGEVNNAERALAKALLEREEARAYLESLRAIATRVREHGAARAPGDFRQQVLAHLEGDFDSISRPTSNQRPMQQLPQAGWRMPLMAAAAAVVVAAGILFTGALTNVSEVEAPGRVGKVNTRNTEDSHGAADFKKTGGSETPPPIPAPPAEPGHSRGPRPQPTKGPGEGGTDDGGDEANKSNARDMQEQPQSLSFEDEATEISVWADRRVSVTRLYTEMLSTSSLYGSARLRASRVSYSVASVGTDFTEYRGIEIEVDEARVPELLAALERLAVEHGMGSVVVPGYLRRSVAGQLRQVDALQDVAQALARGETPSAKELARTRRSEDVVEESTLENFARNQSAADPSARRAAGILPPEDQRAMVAGIQNYESRATNGKVEADLADQRPARTVRLIIRLQ